MKYAVWTKDHLIGHLKLHREPQGRAYSLAVLETLPTVFGIEEDIEENTDIVMKQIIFEIRYTVFNPPVGCERIGPEPRPGITLLVDERNVADLMMQEDFSPFRG